MLVSKGPGSYTGLRIGVSTAKGICYAADLPLMAIDTLEAMAYGMKEKLGNQIQDSDLFIPMMMPTERSPACIASSVEPVSMCAK